MSDATTGASLLPIPLGCGDGEDNEVSMPVLDMLDKLFGSPNSRAVPNDQSISFRKRLGSFTVSAYFAKPICISPIICAASGWEIRSTSGCIAAATKPNSSDSAILVCTTCQSLLAILIPRKMSQVGRLKVLLHYRQQLVDAHSVICPFRSDAAALLRSDERDDMDTATVQEPIIPTVLSRMLPSSSVALGLLERSDARSQFFQYWYEVYTVILPLDQPLVAADSEFLDQCEHDGLPPSSNLLSHLFQIIKMESLVEVGKLIKMPETVAQLQAAETAVAVALMGWDLIRTSTDNEDERAAMTCALCLSCQPLVSVTTSDDVRVDMAIHRDKRRKTIESKWNQPFFAHRYYCPWVCGLPQRAEILENGPALWKTMLDHVLYPKPLLGTESNDAVVNIHKVLRSGISSKRFNPSFVNVSDDCR
jgi:hypothetical protein